MVLWLFFESRNVIFEKGTHVPLAPCNVEVLLANKDNVHFTLQERFYTQKRGTSKDSFEMVDQTSCSNWSFCVAMEKIIYLTNYLLIV